MSDQQRLFSIVGLTLFAIFITGPASGALIPLVDADVTSANAHYATSQNANVGVAYNATDVGAQQGTFTVNTTWGAGDFASRSILFQQTELPLGDFGTTAGLRLQLELSLGNSTGRLWDAFEIRIEDTSAPAHVGVAITGGEGSHLFAAHFHPNSGGIIVGGGLTTPAFNNVSLIELDSGTSGSLIVTNFFLHERNLTDADADEQAVLRNFTLFLTPHAFVSEPAPWALLSIGGLMLIMRCMRRRIT